jgi:hypothetical protein
MSNPITPEFVEKVNSALRDARKESLHELLELGRASIQQPAGKWVTGKEVLPGVSTMPHYSMSDASNKMMKILYELNLIVAFDWMEWEEGNALLSSDDLEKLSGLPAHKIVGLLTALARNDRFCDGAWGAAVEKGKIAKLLSELEKHTNGK